MNQKTQDAIVEAIKELMRVGIIAALPLVIDGLSKGALDLKLVGIAALIAVLRAVDKYVHEEPKIKSDGIIPF